MSQMIIGSVNVTRAREDLFAAGFDGSFVDWAIGEVVALDLALAAWRVALDGREPLTSERYSALRKTHLAIVEEAARSWSMPNAMAGL